MDAANIGRRLQGFAQYTSGLGRPLVQGKSDLTVFPYCGGTYVSILTIKEMTKEYECRSWPLFMVMTRLLGDDLLIAV